MKHVFFVAAVAVLVCGVASAEIPQVLGYQGRITDNSGNPVADGTYAARFRIYDDETAGTLLWDSNDDSVGVAGGAFSVMLGESPHPTLSLAFDADYWLLVTFDGEDQLPRKRLASVGYAYMASGIVPGTEMVDSRGNPIFKGANLGTGAGLRGDSEQGDGVRGQSSATDGRGVYGVANAATGSNYGVYGTSSSTSGGGVFGAATATTGSTYGGRFESSSTTYGRGVFAWAKGSTGQAVGVYGVSSSTAGYGILGEADATTGTNYGVYGETNSTSGRGVYGVANATTGQTVGVYGVSSSTSGYGIFGEADATTGTNFGVCGKTNSTSGCGVFGTASATTGSTYGGRFESNSSLYGRGVYAWAKATSGQTAGVYGVSSSTSGYGVFGEADATTGTNYAVYGETGSPDGYAGYFDGRGYFSRNVGIGTTSPDKKLSAIGTIRAAHEENEFNYVEIYHDGTDAFLRWCGAEAVFNLCYYGSRMMTITQGGSVGIGTVSPAAELHVQGSALVEGGGAPDLLHVDVGTATVGIGTDDCPRKLTVNGDIGANDEITVYESGAERARMGAYNGGRVDTFGPNEEWNVVIGSNPEHANYGRVMVCDDESIGRAGMFINNNGVGETWAGLKLFRMENPNRIGTEICYACIEGPEAAAYIRGTARLENGRASISFPDHFQAVATAEGMTVQLTPRSAESEGLAVTEQSVEGIEVRELRNGTGSYEFHYTVMAVRKGFEDYQVIQPAMDRRPTEPLPAPGT